MIFCLMGDSEVLKELFVKSKVNSVKIIFPDDSDKLEKLERALTSSMMFVENDGIWLKKFKKWNKKEKSICVPLIEHVGKEMTLFVEDEVINGCEKKTFELPKYWDKKNWKLFICKLASNLKIEIEKDAAERLFELFGGKEWAIFSELKKLKTLGKKITVADVDLYTFALSNITTEEIAMDILKNRNSRTLINKMEKKSVSFLPLLSSLTRLILDLGLVKEALLSYDRPLTNWKSILELERITGIKTGRLAKLVGFAFSGTSGGINLVEHYDLSELKRALTELQKLDEAYKNGELGEKSGILELMNLFQK
ncbi:hypothetical protein [Kosmotoga pacifica]|uniref:DNA polymerase III delta N-terminal domain-containing protein n=1 Tax=Kosmotoga pacifica TaxID=1330330 RepID=A0A0G2Z8I6_9BACT|nr:hypothetical protein [Kosmotoga pacifica]AKI97882.1 hypothetical protein IX53_08710 [Kosmotoga pacifica]